MRAGGLRHKVSFISPDKLQQIERRADIKGVNAGTELSQEEISGHDSIRVRVRWDSEVNLVGAQWKMMRSVDGVNQQYYVSSVADQSGKRRELVIIADRRA